MTRVLYQAASKLSVKVIVTAAKCLSSTIDWPLQVHSSALTRLPSPKSSPKPGSRSLCLAKTATYDILELKDHVYARTKVASSYPRILSQRLGSIILPHCLIELWSIFSSPSP